MAARVSRKPCFPCSTGMDALEIIKAYELLKSYGIDNPLMRVLSKDKIIDVGVIDNIPKTDSETHRVCESHQEQPLIDLLKGNVGTQQSYLDQLRDEESRNEENLIRVLSPNEESSQKDEEAKIATHTRTFSEVLTRKKKYSRRETSEGPATLPQKPPRIEGGNVVVDLDVGEYQKAVDDLRFSVVGFLTWPKGMDSPTNQTLKKKLLDIWEIED